MTIEEINAFREKLNRGEVQRSDWEPIFARYDQLLEIARQRARPGQTTVSPSDVSPQELYAVMQPEELREFELLRRLIKWSYSDFRVISHHENQ